jgi:hypothetical protein
MTRADGHGALLMKLLCTILMSTVLGTSLGARDRRPVVEGGGSQSTTESPFFCNVKALSAAARTRHFDELGPVLRSLRIGVRELPDGYAFQFPADPATVALVAEWVAGERACCPFFDIAMTFDREGGPFWLTLTGRNGTKEFIKIDAPDWIK